MNSMDRSNYFRGSLLLIRKDNRIGDREAELVKRIGKALGFEKRFCDTAINDSLENRYLDEIPPIFSTKELAMKFVRDGLILAASDNFIHPLEEQWLVSIVRKNDLDIFWYKSEKEKILKKRDRSQLEVENIAAG